MAATSFTLTTMPRADQQVRDLIVRADAIGFRNDLIDALKSIADQLRTEPTKGADPAHRTRKKGGMVYGLVVEPIFVRFAVFEAEKTVFLLDVKPLARFFPE